MAFNPQFKVNQMAKDMGLKSKELTDLLADKGIGDVRSQKTLSEQEFNVLFQTLTEANQVENIYDYMDGKTCIPSKIAAKKAAAEKAARERAEALEISKKLRDMTLVVTAKGGGAGRLFGSVTNQEIADALKAKSGITLDKRKIVIADPIKSVGTYTVQCKLGYEITAPLTVKIEEA